MRYPAFIFMFVLIFLFVVIMVTTNIYPDIWPNQEALFIYLAFGLGYLIWFAQVISQMADALRFITILSMVG